MEGEAPAEPNWNFQVRLDGVSPSTFGCGSAALCLFAAKRNTPSSDIE